MNKIFKNIIILVTVAFTIFLGVKLYEKYTRVDMCDVTVQGMWAVPCYYGDENSCESLKNIMEECKVREVYVVSPVFGKAYFDKKDRK